MVDHDPKSIDSKELGVNSVVEISQVQDQITISAVLRDRRGRVRWILPGNTPEENEQVGIRNIQGLFLENFPEFEELFPRLEDGKIPNDIVKNVRHYIIEKVGSQKNFELVFSSSPHVRVATPYFEGSHVTALQKSFAPWGIDLMENNNRSSLPLDWHGRSNLDRSGMTKEEIEVALESEVLTFIQNGGKLTEGSLRSHGLKRVVFAISRYYEGGIRQLRKNLGIYRNSARNFIAECIEDEFGILKIPGGRNVGMICWQLDGATDEENLQLAAKNIQGLLLKNFPEFNQQFPRIENGMIEISKRKDARKFLLEHQHDLSVLMGGAVTSGDYFEGSYPVALYRSFLPWGIDLFDIDIHDISSIPRDSQNRILWHLPGRRQKTGRPSDIAVEILQTLFLDKYPDFEQLFSRNKNFEILEEQRSAALQYILSRCGSRLKFIETFGNSPLDQKCAPYFEGSFIIALMKSFSSWGLNFEQEDFKWARKNRQAKETQNYYGDSLLQEYTNMLRSGQIMSLEEFIKMKEGQNKQ